MKKAAAPKAWAPVPVAVQIQRHNAALAAAKKKAAAPQAVQQARHNAAVRAAATRKAQSRKWTPDGAVALCALRAVATAASLTLSDAELLDVYWSAAADADSGMSILAAVAALGWPRLHMPVLGVSKPEPHAVAADPSGLWWSWGALYRPWTAELDEVWGPGWPR